jgi:transposase-like protein
MCSIMAASSGRARRRRCNWDGRRQILAVEMANRESRSWWKDFLVELRRRGLHGVEFVVADDHAGLRAAVPEVLAEAAFQRCYVHILRNALDHLPRKADDDCLQELRWLYDRRSIEEARQDLAAWPLVMRRGAASIATAHSGSASKNFKNVQRLTERAMTTEPVASTA